MDRTEDRDDDPVSDPAFDALGGAAEVSATVFEAFAHSGPLALLGVVLAAICFPVVWLLRREH